jgi:hypothetical protein
MIIALIFIILLVTTIAILILRLIRPTFAYHWLVALLGALVIWPMLLFSSGLQQTVIQLALWVPHSIFPASPVFLLDQLSWSFSLALATLLLSSILIDVARSADPAYPRPAWLDLATSLALTSASLLAVCAGNLLTLLLVWASLDLIELIAWLSKVNTEESTQRVVLTFSSRIVSQVILLWAVITARPNLLELSIIKLDPGVIPFLLLAVGIRLGIHPLSPFFSTQLHLQPVRLSILNLIPVASCLALLCRIATVGVPINWTSPVLVLAALVALYGSFKWFTRANALEAQGDWIITLGALACTAALRIQPGACQSLGIALLLTGGLLFFFDVRPVWLRPLLLIGALTISCLPWTPTWSVVRLYATSFHPIVILFLISQALVLAGYVRYTLQPSQKSLGLERWVWALYIWGLVLLILASLIIYWRSLPPGQNLMQAHPGLVESWPALAVLLLAAIFILLIRRNIKFPDWSLRASTTLTNFDWLYRLVWKVLRVARYFFQWSNTLLESQAGILWAFLLLVLLLTLFSPSNLGR